MSSICILGGGLVGGVLAVALAKRGLSVTVVDRDPKSAMLSPKMDGRTTAISLASKIIFEELGLWNDIAPHVESILDIKVYEIGSPWSIHFDHQMVGKEPMGYIVENRFIRQSIINQVNQYDLITWYDETLLQNKKITPAGVTLSLNNGRQIKASLLVGAEGRISPTREEVGIKSYQFSYHQKALVFSVYHERPHQGVAWEAFHPSGPMAFLPLQECPLSGRPRSGVVWTLPNEQADYWNNQENTAICTKLNELFGFLGNFEVVGDKWNYPLSAQMVNRFIDDRIVILGDAAHVCHPVAGQGVNVGWRDAAVLATHLYRAKNLGVDLGSQQILKGYQQERRFDTWSIFAMTDVMVRLFSNNSSVLYFLRNAGLGTVNRIPPLKRFFMRRAMGFS